MSEQELYRLAHNALAPDKLAQSCQGFLTLLLPKRRVGRSCKIRVMPGVVGKFLGSADNDRQMIVMVRALDIISALLPTMKQEPKE